MQGSGIDVAALPGAGWYHVDGILKCGSCAPRDAACVYLHADPGQGWIVMEVELHCRGCGKYTLWDGQD